MARKYYEDMGARNALERLFFHALRDIYGAELSARKALKRLAGAATLPGLKAALVAHHDEKIEQIARLEEIFAILDLAPKAADCKAMEGILAEADDILRAFGHDDAADAAVIFAAQAIEHYEINRYGALREWARELGHEDASRMFALLRDQEYAADAMLSKIALDRANPAAEGAGAAP